MDLISKFSRNDLVKGLPKIDFKKIEFVKLANLEKKIKTSFKNKNHVSTLQILHMDLFGPSRYTSLSGKYYTWVLFLVNKDDVLEVIMVENLKIIHLKIFAIILALSINFHHQ